MAGPGRPRFEPTDAQRAQVRAMAAYGIPQADIAGVLGIDAKTLRARFQSELTLAAAEANAKVAQSLYRRATEGSGKEAVTAAIFWLKCRGGWRERYDPLPGKKELAEERASVAVRGRFAPSPPPRLVVQND